MRKFLIITTIFFMFAVGAYAQECPADKVCISPEAARKALTDADKVIALEKESAAKDTAIAEIRQELNNIRIEFARVSGEATALRQNAVSDRAIIDILVKQVRKKCMPFTICF